MSSADQERFAPPIRSPGRILCVAPDFAVADKAAKELRLPSNPASHQTGCRCDWEGRTGDIRRDWPRPPFPAKRAQHPAGTQLWAGSSTTREATGDPWSRSPGSAQSCGCGDGVAPNERCSHGRRGVPISSVEARWCDLRRSPQSTRWQWRRWPKQPATMR